MENSIYHLGRKRGGNQGRKKARVKTVKTLNRSQAIRTDSRKIVKVWRANPDLRLKDLELEDYAARSAEFDEMADRIEKEARELKKLRATRDRLEQVLAKLNTRVRNGIRGYFGLESDQFAQVSTGNRAKEIPARSNAGQAAAADPAPAAVP